MTVSIFENQFKGVLKLNFSSLHGSGFGVNWFYTVDFVVAFLFHLTTAEL